MIFKIIFPFQYLLVDLFGSYNGDIIHIHKKTAEAQSYGCSLLRTPDMNRDWLTWLYLIYIDIKIIIRFFYGKLFVFIKKGFVFLISCLAGFFIIDKKLTILIPDRVTFFSIQQTIFFKTTYKFIVVFHFSFCFFK